MIQNKASKINYITHDSWWNSDLPLFPQISKYFLIDVFVFSSSLYKKHFPFKESAFVQNISEVERHYSLKDIRSFISAFKFLKEIKKHYQPTDVNLYVFGDDVYFNILYLLFFKASNTIISLHNFTPHSDSPFYEKAMKKIIIKFYDNFHFQSNTQYKLFKQSYPLKHCFFTEMPVKDFGLPTIVRSSNNQRRTFLFFGLIRDYKRLDLFIEAANEIQEDAHFIIAGNTKEWDEYEHLILDKSKFTTLIRFVDNCEIPNLFLAADFLVLPYSDTTQSGPLLIAYNYGLPIIASDLLMFKDMVTDTENGFLFQQGVKSSLVNAMRKGLTLSDSEYSVMRKNQILRSSNYKRSANTIGEKFQEFLHKLKG